MIAEARAVSIGVLTPHVAPGPEAEWPLMTARRVRTSVSRILGPGATATAPGAPPTSPAGLRSLATPAALEAAASFADGSIDALAYASTSTGYVIGHDAEAALVRALSQRCGVPVEGTSTAAVIALRVMAIERVALVHPPWFGVELNERGADFFRNQGFDVASAGLADLPADPGRIEPDGVIDWISRHVDGRAQAVFIGGNGFRVTTAIDRLEQQIERPVLTSNQVLLWSLLEKMRVEIDMPGYGALFQQRPAGRG